MKTGKLLAFGCFAAIGVGLMSCSKADVFDSNAANELKKEQLEKDYTSNFVKKYGAVEGKSWDFSSMRATYSLPSSSAAGTRAASELSVTGGKNGDMTIEKSVIDEIRTKLTAGTDNTVKGSPFYMVTQETSFTIVPIFQGQAGYYWQLGVNIGGTEKILWSKGDMKYRTSSTSTTSKDDEIKFETVKYITERYDSLIDSIKEDVLETVKSLCESNNIDFSIFEKSISDNFSNEIKF
jgi:hypothetical protein